MYLAPNTKAAFCGDDIAVAAKPSLKRHFHFLLLPGANMLDFSAAIEPLRVINALNGAPAYGWSILSEDGRPVACSNGIEIPADGALAIPRVEDVIVVCSGDSGYLDAGAKALQWLRRHARFGGSVASLATGAFTLARAGLAKTAELTLHWSQIPVFEETFPDLQCMGYRTMPGDTVSYSAGGSACLDLTLTFIQDDFNHASAQRVAEVCLHDFDSDASRTQRISITKRIGGRHPAITNIVRRMEDSIQDPVLLEDLIGNEDISRRQVERLFKRYLGTTPSQYFRNLRLDRARSLLMGTDMSIMEVAVATGFSGYASFSKLYRKRFGERPSSDRIAKSSLQVTSH